MLFFFFFFEVAGTKKKCQTFLILFTQKEEILKIDHIRCKKRTEEWLQIKEATKKEEQAGCTVRNVILYPVVLSEGGRRLTVGVHQCDSVM